MKFVTKAALAGLAGLPVIGLAATPAAALSDVHRKADVTFSRNGQQVTCHLHYDSAFDYDSTTNQSTVVFDIYLSDAKQSCHSAAGIAQVRGVYRKGDGPEEVLQADGMGGSATARTEVNGEVTSLAVSHHINFLCDEPNSHVCNFVF